MNKFLAATSLLIVALGIVQGFPGFGPPAGVFGGPFGGGPFGGGPFGGGPQFFPNARQLAAFPGEKVCAKTNQDLEQLAADVCVTEDLRLRARQLLETNKQGCAGCDPLLDGADPTVLKQYWKCLSAHKKTSDAAVKALQKEAKAAQKACVVPGAGNTA